MSRTTTLRHYKGGDYWKMDTGRWFWYIQTQDGIEHTGFAPTAEVAKQDISRKVARAKPKRRALQRKAGRK